MSKCVEGGNNCDFGAYPEFSLNEEKRSNGNSAEKSKSWRKGCILTFSMYPITISFPKQTKHTNESRPISSPLYENGKMDFEKAGYIEIGMDHFALGSDIMYKAMGNGKLHRNFMGYTSSKTQVMIGLGVSAISDCWSGFAQNVKTIEEYYELLEKDEIHVYRGHILTENIS